MSQIFIKTSFVESLNAWIFAQIVKVISCIIQQNLQMAQQTRVWTLEEDNILRQLREERMIMKWSMISRILEDQFNIRGWNGKKCRQRYQNHLNSSIKRQEWTNQQQIRLMELHNEKGNKWVQIAKELQRSDNSVKNHYHSKLRKALRKINKCIEDHLSIQFKPLKCNILSKIIQTAQDYYNNTQNESKQQSFEAFKLKNNIFIHSQISQQQATLQQIQKIKKLVGEITQFNRKYKKDNCSSNGTKITSNKYKGKEILSLLTENAKKKQFQMTTQNNEKIIGSLSYIESELEQEEQIKENKNEHFVYEQHQGNVGPNMWNNVAQICNNYQTFVYFNPSIIPLQPICYPMVQQNGSSIFSGKNSSFKSYNSQGEKAAEPTIWGSFTRFDLDQSKHENPNEVPSKWMQNMNLNRSF